MLGVPRIPLRSEGNPLFPLPADYESLSTDEGDGQRQARVAACRQWSVYRSLAARGIVTPELAADVFVDCCNFFDRTYLYPDEDAHFNPYFYDQPPMLPAPGHDALLHLWGMGGLPGGHKASLGILPRGYAKSTKSRIANLTRLVPVPAMSVLYVTSTHDNAQDNAERIKTQTYENERIFNDFAREYGGRMKPARGGKSSGTFHFHLTNGSHIRSSSVSSKLRGARPIVLSIDDAEYDKKRSSDAQRLLEDFENFLLRVAMNMMNRPRTSVEMTATFNSLRSYAWKIMQVDPSGRAQDDRFDAWARLLIRAAWDDEAGKRHSCWPDMWPVTVADKQANPLLRDRESLEEIEVRVGKPIFEAEMMANPGASAEQFFPILDMPGGPDAAITKRFGWWIERPDALLETQPSKSQALICWHSKYDEKKMVLEQFLSKYPPFVTADTSHTNNPTSDPKACSVFAYTQDNELFWLSVWFRRCHQKVMVREAFKEASRWGCRKIWAEDTGHTDIVQELRELTRTRASELIDSHVPSVSPIIGMKGTPKSTKIARLGFYFEHSLFKMPTFLFRRAPWVTVARMITMFNPEAEDGGLDIDDPLDTAAMALYAIRGRPTKDAPLKPKKTYLERFLAGEVKDELGDPIFNHIDFHTLTLEQVQSVIALREKTAHAPHSTYA